jgi:hypothetical protein
LHFLLTSSLFPRTRSSPPHDVLSLSDSIACLVIVGGAFYQKANYESGRPGENEKVELRDWEMSPFVALLQAWRRG